MKRTKIGLLTSPLFNDETFLLKFNDNISKKPTHTNQKPKRNSKNWKLANIGTQL